MQENLVKYYIQLITQLSYVYLLIYFQVIVRSKRTSFVILDTNEV